MNPKRIVIIGGSAAGPKTAARVRRLDPEAYITIIERNQDITMASCGYPYYIGGLFDSRDALLETATGVVRNTGYFKNYKDIDVLINTEVTRINRREKNLELSNLITGENSTLPYDKLLIATGSKAKIPPIEGINLQGITPLKFISDADYLRKVRDKKEVKKAVIVGGGLIGLETAEALQLSGIEVSVVELSERLLPFLDREVAKLVEKHCRSKGVNILLESGIEYFMGQNNQLTGVKLNSGVELSCELAVIAIGVTPDSTLAKNAGLKIGETGGIRVNKFMGTSDRNIYAAGDCVEVINSVSGVWDYSPKGDMANLQGRVAADNMIFGDTIRFPGTIGTAIGKIFDFSAGTAGLSETAAEGAGFNVETVLNASTDKPTFMGAKTLISKLTVERSTRRILGYQCVGKGDVSRQIAQGALAIAGEMTLENMMSLDLPYAPPYSLAVDHFLASLHMMDNKLKGLFRGISSHEVYQMHLDRKKGVCFLDLREVDEVETHRLGIGELFIPLSTLRRRLRDVPPQKNTLIVCYCLMGPRSYEASLILRAEGYTNVRVMEGGMMAWPFPREK
ncbi:MAG: FAD-dependent oxidoreductase [Deltaproteobacteria bacterium]|nr:FAD-dependent oxidoreductase [Deltaproteobacteria bacterium]